ncbi:MAG: trypsin-like peptidase domain-containing protein [Chthoniobacterales bacterium]|nr:trypsin-like peptidase domain-containing protein [Chthoniobacterales bacterium]
MKLRLLHPGLLLALMACGAAAQADPQVSAARALGGAFAGVYDKVAPSVVVLEVAKDGENGADALAWEFLFRDQQTPNRRPRVEESEGSGIIIREDGHILTNAHVIEGADPQRGVVARLKDGTRLPLRVVGVDDKTDLAVLKAEAGRLPAVEWGDSDAVRVGEFVGGIGAPFELDYTLTVGVVSAKGRSNLTSTVYEDYIQTDAAINPGNSGGPLCDLDGRVVGVNTLINGLSRGLGFAIPSKIARAVSDELIASGRVVRPWLGIRIETLGENPPLQQMMGLEQGVLVRTIEPDAPAARSGLQPADVIVAVDGEQVSTARELQQSILRKEVGQAVQLKIWRRGVRDGAYRTIAVTTEELPQAPVIASGTGRVPPFRPPPGNSGDTGEASGTLGLQVQDLPEEPASRMGVSAGVVVTHVETGSPAALAGLEPRDVITAVGPNTVRDTESFLTALANIDDASAAVLLVERAGKKTYAILKP